MRFLMIFALTVLAYATPGLAMPDQLLGTTNGKIMVWFNLVASLVLFAVLSIVTISIWDRVQQRRLARQVIPRKTDS